MKGGWHENEQNNSYDHTHNRNWAISRLAAGWQQKILRVANQIEKRTQAYPCILSDLSNPNWTNPNLSMDGLWRGWFWKWMQNDSVYWPKKITGMGYYKIRDRVRVIEAPHDNKDINVGDEGTIVILISTHEYRIKLDSGISVDLIARQFEKV